MQMSIVVGYRDADALKSRAQFLGLTFRIQEMSPPNGHYLHQFVERYRRLGRYRIAPMEYRATIGAFMMDRSRISIEKRLLKIVPAWTIGPDDVLCAALKGVSDPVVPSGEKNPPFHKQSTGGLGYLDRDCE